MMSFTFNDTLMVTVEDDIGAFDIAKSFVGDNNDKHSLFCRVYKSTEGDTPEVKAIKSVEKSQLIWGKYQS